eukprot:CAMPEP_0198197258 /NCGR_PEP_ID=MMETSP1445-20131203/871_1 /TAXON_ID=36898 /ORGANISM="Pyramimonas sp., Strain CCMP2087" /LENGTH=73 /DNA_ID=CAMNT_0043866491 /DNA_START=187 /DNA_END=408 /DNA_ORIENTATION=-
MFITRALLNSWKGCLKNPHGPGGLVWKTHAQSKVSKTQKRNNKKNLGIIKEVQLCLKFAKAACPTLMGSAASK